MCLQKGLRRLNTPEQKGPVIKAPCAVQDLAAHALLQGLMLHAGQAKARESRRQAMMAVLCKSVQAASGDNIEERSWVRVPT